MPLDIARIQALCFDIDGTLRDTDDQYVDRLAGYLSRGKALLRGQEPKVVARRLIIAIEDPGNLMISLVDRVGLDNLVMRLVHVVDKPRLFSDEKPPIVPGVREMLEILSRCYPLAIVSTRSQRVTQDFLACYQLRDFFRVIVTGQTCKRTKPHPMPVLWAAEQMGVSPEACLMVGDTTVDIRAGRAAGAQTVGVLCGFGTEDELRRAGAHLILESTPDLTDYLLTGRPAA